MARTKKPAAQVPFAKKAAATKAAAAKTTGRPAAIRDRKAALAAAAAKKKNGKGHKAHADDDDDDDDDDKVDLASVQDRLTHRCGLLDKHEVVAVVGVTYQTLWFWMRGKHSGTFPRPRIVGGKSKWLAADIADWLAGLSLRPLKGDAPSEKIEEHETA
jgi:predicted DNA-binding transcriptional regulator AlpA